MTQNLSLRQKRIFWAWIFLIPSLAALLFVAGFPLLQTIWHSFTNATLYNLEESQFIGLKNYKYLFSDPHWWSSVWITVKFTVSTVFLETVLGLMIAMMLNRKFKGRGLLRAAILVPWAIPTVVSSKIWEWLYHDQFGFINGMLKSVGLIEQNIAFMGNPHLVLPAIIAVDVWKTTPFMVLLILAGLTTIPDDLYEAAKIDGANAVQAFFKITLPLLKPTLLIALIFRSLDALRVFDIIYVMQGSNESTSTVSIYARHQMIDFQEIGIGSAASFAIFILISVFTIAYIKSLNVDFEK